MKSYCSKKIVMNVTAALAFGLVSTGGGTFLCRRCGFVCK